MVSSEVQRTLVKSPPELWAELSDPAALARHLGELGDIRIVRTQPETTVEWAGHNITGTVSIQPSGWGTKVTLSVSHELAQPPATPVAVPQAADAEAADTGPELAPSGPELERQPEREHQPAPEPEPQLAREPQPAPPPEREPQPAPPPEREPQPAPPPEREPQPAPQRAPRRGFFARLLGRRRTADLHAAVDRTPDASRASADDAFAAVREALAPDALASTRAFDPPPHATDTADARVDISAELMAAEEAGAREVTAVLTAVLDRLGAAHHRPFSRS
jgi:outer membrane biosynthesis protein TonB